MNSAAEILLFLIGASMGLFVLITLLVLLPGRGSARPRSGPIWLGGPSRSERGVSTSGLALADRVPEWTDVPEHDWVTAAETAEPSARTGGASAGW